MSGAGLSLRESTLPTDLSPAPGCSPRRGAFAPHPTRIALLVFGLGLFGVFSAWEHTLGDAPFGSMTVPVIVDIAGLSAADQDQVQVTYLPPRDSGQSSPVAFEEIPPRRRGFMWIIAPRPVEELHITATSGALRRIRSVSVNIGGKVTSFDARELAARWRPIATFRHALDDPAVPEATLEWPPRDRPDQIINLRSHHRILMSVLQRALAIMSLCWCLIVLTIVAMRRNKTAPWRSAKAPHGAAARVWLAAGFAIFCVGIAIARSRQPYAFTQDDSFSQFLPVICRSAADLFQGRFPVWNPHQLLGAPTATIGTYMLTYPPTYASYWIARSVLGDPYLTIEVFVILHLAAGYFVSYLVLRRFGLRPSLAVSGALCFVLSAFLLIGGRSQCTFAPAAVWLPLLARAALALERGRAGWKWALGTGAVVGIYYHAGHAQLWVYGLMFFATAVVLLAAGGRVPWSRTLWSIPALSFGLALATPLLLPQMVEMEGRHFGSSGVGVNLLGMLLPLGRWAGDWRILLTEPEWSGQIPYFGTVFAAAGFLGMGYYFHRLVLCKLRWRHARPMLGQAAWLILMLFATVLALGPDGVLWPLMARFPPFNDFRWPAKVMPFVALFACIGGGQVLERWCARREAAWAPRIATAAMALILLNCYWARATWYTFGDRPYPLLDPGYAGLIDSRNTGAAGRILTRPVWDARSPSAGFFQAQALNFPTVTGAMAVGGYDTFVEASEVNRRMMTRFEEDPLAAARAYGVRWLIWSGLFSRPVFSSNPLWAHIEAPTIQERDILLEVRRHAIPSLAADGVDVYRLPDADPMAFVDGRGMWPLDIRFDTRGATVDAAGVPAGRLIVVNVLWRRWMKAFAGGRPIPMGADTWGRVVVPWTGGSSELTVRYCPPWAMSGLAGVAVALAGAWFGLLLRVSERRFGSPGELS